MVRHEQVTISPSQSPDELDSITVSADIYRGFNWWNLVPGWSFAICTYYGCGPGAWTFAAMGSVPFGSVENGVARGGIASVRAGQAGEAAVRGAYNIGPKSAINIAGRTRIPDGLLRDALSEVKNADYVSYTQQLRDYTQYALDNGLRFDLYVRPGATISGPLLDAESQGLINILEIPF
jgi:restriction endonuclease fold toxin 7 of polymorphic toxin system